MISYHSSQKIARATHSPPSRQCSCVCNRATGSVGVAMAMDYDNVYTFSTGE